MKKALKFALFNNKGGVGKSTLAVHIAHGLSLKGFRVLLIDLDGQNDASLFLGFTSEDYKSDLYEILVKDIKSDDAIVKARDNLFLLPSRGIDNINSYLYKEQNIKGFLAEKLEYIDKFNFDYIIIDCGPQRNKINEAALYYTDGIIVPVQVEAASVRAVGNIYEYLADLNLSSEMISLVVPNMYDKRTTDAKDNLELLRDVFANNPILTEPIYRRVKVTETGSMGKTVYETDRESARQFDRVVERLVAIYGQ